MENELRAPIIGIERHRLKTDGKGVTTLVGFYGCPLHCRYCLNPQSISPDAKVKSYSPHELYEKVKIDDLYFRATGGGITFGGGEPLLYPEFIYRFCELCGSRWNIVIETSLNVPFENVSVAASVADRFIVDIKDTDPVIYQSYTGKSNRLVIENLKKLVSVVGSEKITVRLPLIPDYNDDGMREKSEKLLIEIGITDFDRFTYRT